MATFIEAVPAHIRNLGAYQPGKSIKQAEQESGVTCIKLASNENPYGPSPLAVAAMQRELAGVNFYPDQDSLELRAALAAYAGVQPEQVLPTAGSSDLILLLLRALLGPGTNAVGGDLSFFLYRVMTRSVGATLKQVPLVNYAYDLDAIAAAIDDGTRVVLLANPNNPTGTMFSADTFERFLDKVPERVVVALDEAYSDYAAEFAARRGVVWSRAFDYVRQGRNVLVLRTFSKAHGLAAVRCGWGAGPAELIAVLAKLRTLFSVSSVAQAGALAALGDQEHIRRSVVANAEGEVRVSQALAEMGYPGVPTWTNFIFVETGEPSLEVAAKLEKEGVIVRPMKAWGAPTAIRVTIGTPGQNEQFLTAFRKVMTMPVAH